MICANCGKDVDSEELSCVLTDGDGVEHVLCMDCMQRMAKLLRDLQKRKLIKLDEGHIEYKDGSKKKLVARD